MYLAVQAFLELDIEATSKTITLLGISISMMARILAQLIEGLCILKNSAGSLIQSQELIQLSLNQSLGNMMCPKSIQISSRADTEASLFHRGVR